MHKQLNYSTSALLVGGCVFVGGVVFGLVVGAVSGILLAPQSGANTRKLLHEQADSLGESIINKGLDIYETGKQQVHSVLQRGCDTAEQACESIGNELVKSSKAKTV